ncbi:MAG TPA: hypothetical protein VFU02_21110 [Polyangiaceae bacterium]|nr:hypothetical protein [Polyangiaceae bacterium]
MSGVVKSRAIPWCALSTPHTIATRIEVWSRSPDSSSWRRAEAAAGGKANLSDLGCRLSVDAIWQAALEL